MSGRDTWGILQVTHEGTKTVKISKIQMLTTRFETLRMLEDENFDAFITKLSEIVNSFHALGEPLSNVKICRKILISLPERFRSKVVSIEERPEDDDTSFEELVGKLQTYELNHLLNNPEPQPKKGIAFASSSHDKSSKSHDRDSDTADENIALLAKQFKKFLKYQKSKSRVKKVSKTYDGDRDDSDNPKKDFVKNKRSCAVQCHECHGYGHLRSECGNLKNKNSPGLRVTWDDSSDDSSTHSESANFKAFTGKSSAPLISSVPSMVEINDTHSTSNEEEEIDTLREAYDLLLKETAKLLRKELDLTSRVQECEGEISSLKDTLERSHSELFEAQHQNSLLKEQFVIVKNECGNLVKELNDSITIRETLEKSLSEANDVIK